MINWNKIAADSFLQGVRCIKAAKRAGSETYLRSLPPGER
jgi:hypothetical protein